MNNMYREWKKERGEEAWNSITKIAELYEKWRNNGSCSSDIYDVFEQSLDILEEDGWIEE